MVPGIIQMPHQTHRQLQKSGVGDAPKLEDWISSLTACRPAEFPCDRPRIGALPHKTDAFDFTIPAEDSHALQSFCEQSGFANFVVLLAVFRAAHSRLSGAVDGTLAVSTDLCSSSLSSNGTSATNNLQVVQITVDEESLEDVISQVQQALFGSKPTPNIPFGKVISMIDTNKEISGPPLLPILFNFNSDTKHWCSSSGHNLEPAASAMTSMFDIEFHLLKEAESLRGKILFCSEMYERETINSIISVFKSVLSASALQMDVPIKALPLLTEDDYAALNTKGLVQTDQTDYPRDSSVIDIFRQQAAVCPFKVAIKDSTTELTYSQLDCLSDAIALWLAKQSFPPESMIGVLADRTCNTVAVFLGILKANLAYLPFDVRSPVNRIEAILSSISGPRMVLVGQGIEPPALQLEDVQFVPFHKAFADSAQIGLNGQTSVKNSPSATNLAYVMFTSGSTGAPKGVMVEHRGIVRLVKESNMAHQLPRPLVMAHLSNTAFDAATWEIYGALLNGGTLICIDTATVLDCEALGRKFADESVQTAFFTTALFKQYSRDYPSIISDLEMICAGGERLDPRDLAAALDLMNGRFVHVYGPTENTTFSTMYPVLDTDSCRAAVPIGHAISNSGAFVMDPQQCLVPLGVLGELVVTGDGLARGYTDPKLDLDRFICIKIGGKQVKAYRTGDLVRHRPSDGQLDFIGRLDGQVKIRGNRVELGEIEHILCSHDSVRDGVAILKQEGRNESQLACFVTINFDAKLEQQTHHNGEESKRVQAWSHLYDENIYSQMSNMSPEKVGRDFMGWTSMYDGQAIDRDEMSEWLDDAIAAILNGGAPGHVLEIGTGSGMILFNLGKGLKNYVGLDPSEAAFAFVARMSKAHPVLADKVHLYKATALEIGHLDTVLAPNVAILNSVVQYFPSQEYLFRVIQDLLQLPGLKSIFFGDIRSQALYQQFRVTRALKVFGTDLHKNDMLSQIEAEEGELLLDPGFFTSLVDRLPEHVEHVEILPKRMKATNELSCYRYAAVVQIKHQGLQKQQIRRIDEEEWIDFRECGLDPESLLQLLKRSASLSAVPVCNIPYSKTVFERFAVDCLLSKSTAADANWFQSACRRAEQCPSLSPADLIEISKKSGFRVEISWARQYSLKGGFDAIFHRYEHTNESARLMFHFPTDHQGRELASFSSQPLRLQAKQEIHKQLQETLKANLPSYMIPKQIKILDEMPVNPNGKVDRRLLAQMIQDSAAPKGFLRQPTTDAERQMRIIWAEVLNINVNTFGLDHSFFDLGGTSIDAMRIVGLARKAGFDLTVQEIFRRKKLGDLVPEQIIDSNNIYELLDSVELIDPVTKKNVLASVDALNLKINSQTIADVLPITYIQHEFLYCPTAWRQYIDYFYMDLENNRLDLGDFKQACDLTLERHPILRTCFLRVMGKYWQFILHQLDSPLRIEDVEGDFDSFFHTYILNDLHQLKEFEPPLAIILFRHKDHGIRLTVRMQHAQNDALSIPIIFKSLLQGHDQTPSSSDAPTFSQFMSYVSQKRPMAIEYWKNLLQGASITQIKPRIRPSMAVADPKPLAVHAETDLPALPDNTIMISTLVNAAWTVFLARATGKDDVAYWQFVAGRNSAIRGVEDIVGPCMASAPTRVILSTLQTPLQLLRFIQDQLMASGEADSLSNEIVEQCTSWPSGIMDSVIQHQSFGETPSLECFGAERQIRFFENPYLLEPYPWIASFIKGNRLHISLFTTTGLVTVDKGGCMVKDICKIAEELITGCDMPLQQWLQKIELSI